MSDKYFYTKIADDFDRLMNEYDVSRRVEIIFAELLPANLRSKLVLDAGAGTGIFSREAAARNARVVSVDLGDTLLKRVAKKARCLIAAADILQLPFPSSTFDFVISSEVIEHTPDPRAACIELGRVLKPGGLLALTCPNRVWQLPVRLASRLSLRPFAGIENFPGFRELRRNVEAAGLTVERHFGFHPWPFQLSFLRPLSKKVDRLLGHTLAARWMINQAVIAVKRP
jgi:2-polyprenyl-3-methyl-5-hydroxy-6-metoxy-1,4-benzoquinol methylase